MCQSDYPEKCKAYQHVRLIGWESSECHFAPSKLHSTQINTALDLASSDRCAANVSIFERDHNADQFYPLLSGYFHI